MLFPFVRLILRSLALGLLVDGIKFKSPGLAGLVAKSSVGKLMLLTVISCYLAVATVLIMQIKDFLGKHAALPSLFIIAKKLFALALAFNSVVFALFWPIFFYDAGLLAPRDLIAKAGGQVHY